MAYRVLLFSFLQYTCLFIFQSLLRTSSLQQTSLFHLSYQHQHSHRLLVSHIEFLCYLFIPSIHVFIFLFPSLSGSLHQISLFRHSCQHKHFHRLLATCIEFVRQFFILFNTFVHIPLSISPSARDTSADLFYQLSTFSALLRHRMF